MPTTTFWALLARLPIAQCPQAELSRRLGISASVISQWRRYGVQPEMRTIQKVAARANVPVSYFLQAFDDRDSRSRGAIMYERFAELVDVHSMLKTGLMHENDLGDDQHWPITLERFAALIEIANISDNDLLYILRGFDDRLGMPQMPPEKSAVPKQMPQM